MDGSFSLDTALPADHLPGANHPPPDAPDPFGAHEANILDLYEEARNWLDGAAIENQAQADCVEALLEMIDVAHKAADAERVKEKAPHDQAIDAIQTKWNPLIGKTTKLKGKTVLMREGCLSVLTKWKQKLLAEQEAAAAKARTEATAKAQAAAEAARNVGGDLGAAERAEDLIRVARNSLRDAKAAEKPTVKGMRTIWRTTMTDPTAAARWAWNFHRHDCEAFFQSLAERSVREGHRTVAGFEITPEKVAY
jgi:hypothetical protein